MALRSPFHSLSPLACGVLSAMLLSACGGSDDPVNPATFTLGGTLSGLAAGQTVVLQNQGGDDLRLSANGSFQFATPLASGAAYAVTVMTAPASQRCTVTHGSGQAQADVRDVAVACTSGPATPPPGTPPPSTPPLASGTGALEGDWINEKVCSPLGNGQSARQMVKLVRQGDTAMGYQAGTALYNNASCQGAGSAMVSPIATLTLTRVESNATVAAHWGALKLITGTTSYHVFAKLSVDKLCLLGDENPSILPTLGHVAQSAAVQDQQSGCFVRR